MTWYFKYIHVHCHMAQSNHMHFITSRSGRKQKRSSQSHHPMYMMTTLPFWKALWYGSNADRRRPGLALLFKQYATPKKYGAVLVFIQLRKFFFDAGECFSYIRCIYSLDQWVPCRAVTLFNRGRGFRLTVEKCEAVRGILVLRTSLTY